MSPWKKPTKEALQAAVGRPVPDVIAPNLKVLFVGINPGLYTAVVGYHFAHPSNRFWKALHAAGITDRRLHFREVQQLLDHSYGITNIVARATASAADLSRQELIKGGEVLKAKVCHYRPRLLAFLGITAYRMAFGAPGAAIGPQEETISDTPVWLLPNPSGLNAHYRLEDMAALLRQLVQVAEQ